MTAVIDFGTQASKQAQCYIDLHAIDHLSHAVFMARPHIYQRNAEPGTDVGILSFRLLVCLSQSSIVTKRLNVSPEFLHHLAT